MSEFYQQLEHDISCEITEIHSSNKRIKAHITYYALKIEISGFFFYEIWLSDDLRLQEEEEIKLNSAKHNVTAMVVSVHEYQNATVKLDEKLTQEIYTVRKDFDPTFILSALRNAFTTIIQQPNEIAETLREFLDHNAEIKIEDLSSLPNALNESQKNAVKNAERWRVSFIWGPPGTGKTYTLAQIIYRAYLRSESVLVLSTSNVALDQVLLAFHGLLKDTDTSNIFRIGHSDDKTCAAYTRDAVEVITQQVIFSTLAAAAIRHGRLSPVRFDLVLVDESSMVSLPYIYTAANLSNRNMVIAGDFCQLPPIALSNTSMENNIYEYLAIPRAIEHGEESPWLAMLDIQYRMAQPISDLVSNLFYNNRLRSGVSRQNKNCLIFINADMDTAYRDAFFSVLLESYYNPLSLPVVQTIVQDPALGQKTVMAITPYRAQQNLLGYLLLTARQSKSKSLTIHRSQGSEADVVVFDLTTHARTNQRDYAKLLVSPSTSNLINVALSRAKEQLYILGSLKMITDLSRDFEVWERMLKQIRDNFRIIPITAIYKMMPHFKPALAEEEVVVGIDKTGRKDFIRYFENSKAKKKVYFLPESRIAFDASAAKGIIFRRLPNASVPEMYIWGNVIAIKDSSTYRMLESNMAAEILRRISIGHLVDVDAPTRANTFILNCERCGCNREISFDESRHCYVLQCAHCKGISYISEKTANDLRVVYDIRCPACGADMKPRKKHGSRNFSFFGCCNYPRCNGLITFRSLT